MAVSRTTTQRTRIGRWLALWAALALVVSATARDADVPTVSDDMLESLATAPHRAESSAPDAPAIETLEGESELALTETGVIVPEDAASRRPWRQRSALHPRFERKRMGALRRELSPEPPDTPQMRIQALDGFLNFDETDQIIYAPGRTVVRYGKYLLEADKLYLDTRLREVQADGNVILVVEGDVINAESMRYNFEDEEGVGYEVNGQHGLLHFRPDHLPKPGRIEHTERQADKRDPRLERPQIHKTCAEELTFHNSRFSTCDFKIPHYNIRAREAIIFLNDRVFFRSATFYVGGVPVGWLPFYSRSLVGGTPWEIKLGYNSRTGARIRVAYTYEYLLREPKIDDDERYENRHKSRTKVYMDYLWDVGRGQGVEHEYSYDSERHTGLFELYSIHDHDRRVVGPDDDDTDDFGEGKRWQWLWRHRSQLTDDLNLVANIDAFSDPDMYYDILDLFRSDVAARERQIQRRGRVALTWTQEAYVARMMVELKDRIGRDRLNDWSDAADDNRDFDLDPYDRIEDIDVDGISKERWGRVAAKLPHLNFATRWLPIHLESIRIKNLYYKAEIDLYNSLDKGLNVVDDFDDDYVQGLELYNALMYRWKLTERYVVLAQAGVGMGWADRNDPHFNHPSNTFPQTIDALTFVDDDGTFLVGTRRTNYDDIEPFYAWADAGLRLNARFTDALAGRLLWRGRATTSDFIGDWYARLGSTTFREDLYDYKLRENLVHAGLDYTLLDPDLRLYTGATANLVGSGDLYANEDTYSAYVGADWSSPLDVFAVRTQAGVYGRQTYDPSDLREFEQRTHYGRLDLAWAPIHRRWDTSLRLRYSESVRGRTETNNAYEVTYFTEDDRDVDVLWIYGRELGPKWDTEIRVRYEDRYSGLSEVSWLLQRDLHDALATLEISAENNEERSSDRRDDSNYQLDVRLGLELKTPEQTSLMDTGHANALGDTMGQTIQRRAYEPLLK